MRVFELTELQGQRHPSDTRLRSPWPPKLEEMELKREFRRIDGQEKKQTEALLEI